MIFVNDMTIPLHMIEQATGKDIESKEPMRYKFVVILPKQIIEDKTDSVRLAVQLTIEQSFIYPFVILTVILMGLTSICLSKISKQITEPIIELYEKIKLIIDSHQKEKIELIKQ